MPLYAGGPKPPTKYMFINGAYLSAFAANKGEEWFGRPADIDYELLGKQLDGVRTFYYDCLPARAVDRESETDFQRRLTECVATPTISTGTA